MSFSSQLLVAVALLPISLAHLCVWSPMQRGDYSIEIPGSHDCYRKVGPCGGEEPGKQITNLDGGSSFLVEFQQNLNHYTPENPGSLVIDYAIGLNPSESDFMSLAGGEGVPDYNAMNMITQTNFSRYITVPDRDAEAAVLRVRYLSNNPEENDRGEVFYQCSDISITSSSKSGKSIDVVKAETATKVRGADDDEHLCCAPKSFQLSYTYSNPSGGGTIWYDADDQQIRVDFDTTSGSSHSMYINYTSGIEWYVDNADGTCDEYGCDEWIDWCFGGDASSETYVSTEVCGGQVEGNCNVYENGAWTFTATADECYPASLTGNSNTQGQNGPRFIEYFNTVEGPIDPSVFVAPCSASSKRTSLRSGDKIKKPLAPHHLASVLATPHAHKHSHPSGKKN